MRSSSATAGSKSGPAYTPTAPRGALKLPQRLLSTRERSLGSQEAPSEASQLCHGPGRPPCRARGFPTRRLEEEREANIQAPQPIVQRAPLQRREQDLQLTKFVNTRQMVTLGQAANGEMTGVYYCKVCECHLRDSANYLLHINGAERDPNLPSLTLTLTLALALTRAPTLTLNLHLSAPLTPPLNHAGKKHNRMLGMSMRAERATLGEVRERLVRVRPRVGVSRPRRGARAALEPRAEGD